MDSRMARGNNQNQRLRPNWKATSFPRNRQRLRETDGIYHVPPTLECCGCHHYRQCGTSTTAAASSCQPWLPLTTGKRRADQLGHRHHRRQRVGSAQGTDKKDKSSALQVVRSNVALPMTGSISWSGAGTMHCSRLKEMLWTQRHHFQYN